MSHIILKNNLFNEILLNPARDYDELCVVSGYATPAMATHHLQAVKDTHNREDLKVNLIIGMTPSEDGISKAHHENFIKLITEKDIFKCSYINPEADPTHTKLYTWLKDGRPQKAFLASANYTSDINKMRLLRNATPKRPMLITNQNYHYLGIVIFQRPQD